MSQDTMLHTVTGATGYTGRYITSLLLEQGHRVQSITGHPDRPNPFGDLVNLHPFNFDNPQLLQRSLEGTDTLFNTYWIRVSHQDRSHEQWCRADQGHVPSSPRRRRQTHRPH